jgi:hypothetical protein
MTAQPRSTLAGIGLMLTGVFLFSFNDAVGNGWSRPIRSGSCC